LRGTGVSVTALCPGPTRTGFQKHADMAGSYASAGDIIGTMDAARVARIGYRALMRGKPLVVAGLLNKTLVQAERLLPRWVVRRAVRIIQSGRGPACLP